MKKTIYLLTGIMFISFILFSCSDENKEELNNNTHKSVYSNSEDIAMVYKIDKKNKKVIFYVPNNLTSIKAFSQSDVAEFTIYEDMEVEKNVILKPGKYPQQYDSKGNYAYVTDTY